MDILSTSKSNLSSVTVTADIEVQAVPNYVSENSNPQQNEFLFSYNIVIINKSSEPVKLISRFWKIIDANGIIEEVKGAGVVGQTPTIDPGERFEYQSFCPLKTNWGTIEGHYEFEESGRSFNVQIDRFFLVSQLNN